MYIFHFYQLLKAAMINHTCRVNNKTNQFNEILYYLLNAMCFIGTDKKPYSTLK